MTDRLEQLNQRYDELSAQLAAPETYVDAALSARLNRERRELEPVAECFRELTAAQDAFSQTEALLRDDDSEVRELARGELSELRTQIEELEENLRELLVPRDPLDDRDVILEIRAGVGGEEAALFAHSLSRMYAMYAAAKGWEMETANAILTELGGVKEAVYTVSGPGAYARLKYESGTHRVQRVPETESGGRIHTSTATVAVLPQVEDAEFELDWNDVRMDTFRASGAGGQHVNTTDSAVRLTHIPTGVVVECDDERSQHKNRERAFAILRAELYERQRRASEEAVAARRRSQVGTGMRNERIRTYNFPQGRVTDHRIGLTLRRIDDILDGNLDLIIDPLARAEREEQMTTGKAQT